MSLRPDWDDVWLQVAGDVAARSLCVRAQVGAVIVDQANRIVATGYNGPPAGFEHGARPCREWCERGRKDLEIHVLARDYADCVALHAEANALSVCDRSTRTHGTMYVMGPPCFACAKLVANSGLATIVIGPDRSGNDVSYRSPEASILFLERCGIEVVDSA